MSVLEDIERGRVWILTTLFQVVEDCGCILDDLVFIPMNDGQQLTLKIHGQIVSAKFAWSEIAACAETSESKMEVLSNRGMITQRLRELINSHRHGNSCGSVREGSKTSKN